MSLFNWRRRRTARIDEVIVPDSVMDGTDDPPVFVLMFVRDALTGGRYERDELPREALLAAHVEYYRGEVNNGGHAQFVSNSDWDEEIRADIGEGLATLELDEAARIFADFEAFAEAEPERFDRCDGGADEIDPFFFALDDRFNGPVAEAIAHANAAWIRTRPWLRPIPQADYFANNGWSVPPHPLRNARIAASRRRNRSGWG